MVGPTSTSTWEAIVKTNELPKSDEKRGFWRIQRKFRSPTKW